MLYFFILLFLIGVVGSSMIITRKIPLVLATPRQMIDDYFQQSSTRFYVRVMRVKKWVRHGGYWDQVYATLLRFLKSTHILFMKLERITFKLQTEVKEKSEEQKLLRAQEENPAFWQELKPEEQIILQTTPVSRIPEAEEEKIKVRHVGTEIAKS